MLNLSDQFGCLFGQGERQDGVGENSGQVRDEALVYGKDSFGSDRLPEAVEDAAVEVAVLVVQTRHDGICIGRVSWQDMSYQSPKRELRTRGVHDAANHEAADCAAGEMQSRALLHAGVLDQLPLGQEIRGQLDRRAEAGSNHGGRDAAVQAQEALATVDLPQSIPGIPVVVLRAHGPHGREALQPRLDEEEGTASSRTEDSGRGAGEDVDAQVLRVLVLEEQRGQRLSYRVVEAQAAAVEQHLVDVGGAEPAVDALDALVLDDDADAVDGAAIVLRLRAFGLQLALQLLSDLEHLGRVRDCDGSASCQSACGETAVRIRSRVSYGFNCDPRMSDAG